MPVEHAEWGNGVVIRVEDDRVVVLLDEIGYKILGIAAVTSNDRLRVRQPTETGTPCCRG
jgi:ATP-dependent DNA helicase RecQ